MSRNSSVDQLLLVGGRVVTRTQAEIGWIGIRRGLIETVGAGTPPADQPGRRLDVAGCWIFPGFVDLHVHGGGGHDVTESTAAAIGAAAFHRRHGTTRTLLSLAAAPVDQLSAQAAAIAAAVDHPEPDIPRIVGSHLEGPFLTAAKCGAQNPAYFIEPCVAAVEQLIEAGRLTVRSMTLAPELPGAPAVVRHLTERGVIAALGHTATGYREAIDAIDAGASLVTHLGNAMNPLHHREPGLIGAAFERHLACELIHDGHHVHPALTRLLDTLDPAMMVLITDAIAMTGMGDGMTTLANQAVMVTNGVARVVATNALAGSTLTLDRSVAATIAAGVAPHHVAQAVATNPARLLGRSDQFGEIRPGLAADLAILNDDFVVEHVMVDGRWQE